MQLVLELLCTAMLLTLLLLILLLLTSFLRWRPLQQGAAQLPASDADGP
jgi:hypothetical protein